MKAALAVAVMASGAAAPAHAVVETIVGPDSQYLAPLAMPRLPKLAGWMVEPGSSLSQGVKILVADGSTLQTTPAMISARALPRAANPQITTLDAVIIALQSADRQSDPRRSVIELAPVTDKAGRQLRVYRYLAGNGAVGLSAYGADKGSDGADYWITLTLTARSGQGLADNQAVFHQMIADYQ